MADYYYGRQECNLLSIFANKTSKLKVDPPGNGKESKKVSKRARE